MGFRKFWERVPRTDYTEYFNDFLTTGDYVAGDWTITTTEAGANAATEVISTSAGPNGVLVITNDDAATDADYLQNKIEAFQLIKGKKAEFEIRFKISDVVNTAFVAGLQITDTTPLDVSDGVFLRKAEDVKNLELVVCKDGSEDKVVFPDDSALVNDTWVKAGWYYDGTDRVDAYVNDMRVASVPADKLPTSTPLDLAELLAVSFGLLNSSAAAHVLSIDYIRVRTQR